MRTLHSTNIPLFLISGYFQWQTPKQHFQEFPAKETSQQELSFHLFPEFLWAPKVNILQLFNLIVAKNRESPNTYNAFKRPSTLKRSFVKGNDWQWEKIIVLAQLSTRRIRKVRWTNSILKALSVVCLLLDPCLNTIEILNAKKGW